MTPVPCQGTQAWSPVVPQAVPLPMQHAGVGRDSLGRESWGHGVSLSLRATPSGQVRRTQPVHAVTGPWSEQLQGSTTHPHPRHTLTPGGRSPGQAWARVGPAAGPGLGWHLSGEGRGLCVLAVVSLATWCVFVILVPPPPPPLGWLGTLRLGSSPPGHTPVVLVGLSGWPPTPAALRWTEWTWAQPGTS